MLRRKAPPALEAPEDRAFLAFSRALELARHTGALRDMAAAVRAYETWLVLVLPNPADRADIWP